MQGAAKVLEKCNEQGKLASEAFLFVEDLPGARWPGAVMAKAFIIHGLRSAAAVEPMMLATRIQR